MSNNTVTPISGVSTFTNFQFTDPGLVTLTATSGALSEEYVSINIEIFDAVNTFPYYENFENSFGVWQKDDDVDLDFDWYLNSGATPNGPTTGPYGPNSGTYYIYTESTYGSTSDEAIIYADFDFTGFSDPTLRFRYHRHGTKCGNLNVDISLNDGGTWTNGIWSVTGETQAEDYDEYSLAVIDLSAYGNNNNVRIRIRMIRDNGTTGDVAIDKLEITAPTCEIFAEDFEDVGYSSGDLPRNGGNIRIYRLNK